MNKASLIERIAAEVAVSKKTAEEMLDTMVTTIIKELQVGNEVTITGFGTFLSKTRHARGGVNPQNPSERIQIPEVKVAKFKTGKTLKDAMKASAPAPKEEEPTTEEAPTESNEDAQEKSQGQE